jgi:hypothetical protein
MDWYDDGYADACAGKYLPPYLLEVGIRAAWRYKLGWLRGRFS